MPRTLPRSIILVGAAAVTLLVSACGPRGVDQARKDGDFNYEYGRYAEASTAYLEIIDRYPGDWEAEYRYGMCLVKLGNPKEARTHIETAADANPSSREVAFALADVYASLDERARMTDLLRSRALRLSETESWVKLAELGRQLNDLDLEELAVVNGLRMRGEGQWQMYVYDAKRADAAGNAELAMRRLRQAYYLNPYSPIVTTMLRERGEEVTVATAIAPEQ
ncbi:MAG: tetratricopeptide repeat protein [Phycisphaerae bacterium]|nr:tetratricopeptide repeat protein [Phycisphaerae bacterium]